MGATGAEQMGVSAPPQPEPGPREGRRPSAWETRTRRSFCDVAHSPSYHQSLPAVADLISAVASRNAKVGVAKNVFDGTRAAPISVKDFLVRLCKYGHCSPDTFVTMLLYLDRLNISAGIELSPLNVHRLMLVAFVLAVKAREDEYYSNAYYASVGGISTKELNSFERVFLRLIDFELWADPAEHQTYLQQLKRRTERIRERRAARAAGPSPTKPTAPPPPVPRPSPCPSPSARRRSSTPSLRVPEVLPPRSESVGLVGTDDYKPHPPVQWKQVKGCDVPSEVIPDLEDAGSC